MGLIAALMAGGACGGPYEVRAPTGKGVDKKTKHIHPAVLGHVLMSPELPLGSYFRLAVAIGADHEELSVVRARATELAGDRPPAARHYHRAAVEHLTGKIQRGLADHPGGVSIRCCRAVDAWNDELSDASSSGLSGTGKEIAIELFVNKEARFIRVEWFDRMTSRELSWDLSAVPNAFDDTAPLEPRVVAETIRALHPPTRWYD